MNRESMDPSNGNIAVWEAGTMNDVVLDFSPEVDTQPEDSKAEGATRLDGDWGAAEDEGTPGGKSSLEAAEEISY